MVDAGGGETKVSESVVGQCEAHGGSRVVGRLESKPRNRFGKSTKETGKNQIRGVSSEEWEVRQMS